MGAGGCGNPVLGGDCRRWLPARRENEREFEGEREERLGRVLWSSGSDDSSVMNERQF